MFEIEKAVYFIFSFFSFTSSCGLTSEKATWEEKLKIRRCFEIL
jgi:hypothetical protein